MLKERLLTTIVHISDLHFGDLGRQDDATLSAAVVDWWRIHPLFNGYLGHQGIALRHLDEFMATMKADGAPILLITGDITANGAESQFDLVSRYLSSTITLSSGEIIGLEMPEVMGRTIPGNHDHWPGRTAKTV
jgi:3',5'-cyclic AMP phosphodiesterase CpdA